MPGKKDPDYLENLPPTQIVHSLATAPSPNMTTTMDIHHHPPHYPLMDELEVDRLVTSIREQLAMGPKFLWGATADEENYPNTYNSYNSCIHSPSRSLSSLATNRRRHHPYNNNANLRGRRRTPADTTNNNSNANNSTNTYSTSNCTSELAALQALIDSRSLIKEAVRRLQDHTRRQLQQDSRTPPHNLNSDSLSDTSSWPAINTL